MSGVLHPCRDCGARRAIRAGVRCADCAAVWRRSRRRAGVTAVPQPGRPELPPLGVFVADDDGERIQCHSCGRFVAALGTHVRAGHGLDPADYRARYGLNRTAALISPALATRQRATQSAHLAAIRPAVSGLAGLSRAQLAAGAAQPRRAQMRLGRSAAAAEQAARQRPVPAPKPPALPLPERLARARAGRAANMDPAQFAAAVAAYVAGESYRNAAARHHVSPRRLRAELAAGGLLRGRAQPGARDCNMGPEIETGRATVVGTENREGGRDADLGCGDGGGPGGGVLAGGGD